MSGITKSADNLSRRAFIGALLASPAAASIPCLAQAAPMTVIGVEYSDEFILCIHDRHARKTIRHALNYGVGIKRLNELLAERVS